MIEFNSNGSIWHQVWVLECNEIRFYKGFHKPLKFEVFIRVSQVSVTIRDVDIDDLDQIYGSFAT